MAPGKSGCDGFRLLDETYHAERKPCYAVAHYSHLVATSEQGIVSEPGDPPPYLL